ncbi:MAG: DHA2 family efflux MFS transporter permease subunit [Pseudomonadota bacterium]|nr:DHA2 family efflux MFS transporter permease subunit [Pseudomonadota bacterium]
MRCKGSHIHRREFMFQSGTMLQYMTTRRVLLVATVQLTTLLFGMTITVVAVVMPQIQGALSATQDQVAWTITFNLVATAIATPITGALAARLGWRNLLLGSVGGFTISTALCGLSTSLEMLVMFRVLQGVFGAPLLPLGQGMLMASFPKHMHALVLTLWGIGGVFGPVLGPIFGGFVAEAIDWRWAFFMIVPFGVLGMLGAWISLDGKERDEGRRVDWLGYLLLAIAIGAATLILNRGQRLDWFDSTEIIVEASVCAIAFYLYLVHSVTAANPLFQRELFRDRNFVIGLAMSLLMGMFGYTPMVMFPPLLSDVAGYPESIIGTLLTSRGIGNWLSFLLVVQFTRVSARGCLIFGLVCQAIASGAMAQLDVNVTEFDVYWTNVLHGFGFGIAYTPMSVLAFTTLRPHLMVDGSSLFNVMRHFGSVLFISVAIVVLTRSAAQSYSGLREWISPFNMLFTMPGVSGDWSHGTLGGLSKLSGEILRQASMIGYINAFYLLAATAALGVPLALAFRPVVKPTPDDDA